MSTQKSDIPFANLDPETVIQSIESLGIWVGGEVFALNSYENRVYSFKDDDGKRWVAKFYRPNRWSDDAILEEHLLIDQLSQHHVPVGQVWKNTQGESLFHVNHQRLSLFPHVSGRSPMLESFDELYALGQLIGKMHSVSEKITLRHRQTFDPVKRMQESQQTVLSSGRLSGQTLSDYQKVSDQVIATLGRLSLPTPQTLVIHNDCHPGNLLGLDDQYSLVDFDDCAYGPAIQDLWMFLNDPNEQVWRSRLAELIEGYEEFREFDRREIGWIEALRTVRLMQHSAWILNRWQDPAFPKAFPWVSEEGYWQDHNRALEAQRVALASPMLWA